MAILDVNKKILKELELMGFSSARARAALCYLGNCSIEDAVNWILEHENNPDIDQVPQFQVPINIQIESGKPPFLQEEMEVRLKELREQARKKKQEEEKRMEWEREKERIRMGKQLMEAKRVDEENERKRTIASREVEKEEGKKARERIRRQLEQDKAERRRMLGLPPKDLETVKPATPPIQKAKIQKALRPIRPSIEERLSNCLRSLKKNHKDDVAQIKKAFQTLLTYVGNVARNPDNERYRKIRLSNPAFQDRVSKYKECIQFLELCGFEKNGRAEPGFLYMPRNKVDVSILNSAGLALNSAITNPFFGMLSF
ncbi:hypothetical protein AXF42_Ash004840 [Apostasia shenzhenica]|uniref:UBA domain-containing protein n=1 Tax=Apostasia shenzhenica TaxID=1088818 RepID=A0A2I0B7V3_9ASPA|nr:hypothetical protein AXF42_Ash004840 [Apostasia shenzhenica]